VQPPAQRFRYTVVAACAAPADSSETNNPTAIRARMRGTLAAPSRVKDDPSDLLT
jgi:hypothetical protein